MREGRLRQASEYGDKHRAVHFVAVVVNGHHDLAQCRINPERGATYQFRVLQGDAGRKERFWHTSTVVHCVETVMSAQIADEVEAIVPQLRCEKMTRRKQRFYIGPIFVLLTGLDSDTRIYPRP